MASRSKARADFISLIVVRTVFTGPYCKDGQQNVSEKIEITAYKNEVMRNGVRREEPPIKLTAWGKLAHVFAKSLSPGKELHAFCRVRSYPKRVYQPSTVPGQPGAPVLKADGTILTVDTVGFEIEDYVFGADSAKHIDKEIADGIRPPHWNVKGHPEEAMWKERLKARSAAEFNPNASVYGFAKVRNITGSNISAWNPALEQGNATPQDVQNTFTSGGQPMTGQSLFGTAGV
jgi:hypothetical protein